MKCLKSHEINCSKSNDVNDDENFEKFKNEI